MNIAYVKTQGKPKFIASIKKVGNGSQRGGAGTKSELKNNSPHRSRRTPAQRRPDFVYGATEVGNTAFAQIIDMCEVRSQSLENVSMPAEE
jgi:hypothetical protein